MYIPASTERFSWTKVRCTINERDAQTKTARGEGWLVPVHAPSMATVVHVL